jgi:hypothetical protein
MLIVSSTSERPEIEIQGRSPPALKRIADDQVSQACLGRRRGAGRRNPLDVHARDEAIRPATEAGSRLISNADKENGAACCGFAQRLVIAVASPQGCIAAVMVSQTLLRASFEINRKRPKY